MPQDESHLRMFKNQDLLWGPPIQRKQVGVKPAKPVRFLPELQGERFSIELVSHDDMAGVLDVVQFDGRDGRIHALECGKHALANVQVSTLLTISFNAEI